MSSSSDSEEFYDAEDITPSHGTRKPRKSSKDSLGKRANSEPNVSAAAAGKPDDLAKKPTNKSEDEFVFIGPKSKRTPTSGRRKFKELRQKLQNDDEDVQTTNVTPPNSQTSSVEGVFAASSKTSHPFRIIEQDTVSLQSINSLGRVARILGGVAEGGGAISETGRKAISVSALSSSSLDSGSTPSSKGTSQYPSSATISTITSQNDYRSTIISENQEFHHQHHQHHHHQAEQPSPPTVPLQEPDVIASTKASSSITQRPTTIISGGGSIPTTGADTISGPTTTSTTNTNKTPHQTKLDAPVAPPRLKKKNRNSASLALKKSASSATFVSSDLASPASTIESLTREFEHSLDRLPSSTKSAGGGGTSSKSESQSSTLRSGHSLDIKQALKGQFVVKPQDNDSLKAQNVNNNNKEQLLLVQQQQQHQQQPTTATAENATSSSGSPRGSSGRSSVGHYSLGPHRGTHQHRNRTSKERRRSAGDVNTLGISLRVRTHTDSGKQLSDLEILEQVTVLNLDTGERVPLSVAEDKLPQCINPLSLHIMRLTSEYVSSSSMEKEKESDEESVDNKKSAEIPIVDDNDPDVGRMRKKTAMLKRFVGTAMKKTMHKAKSIAQEVSHARHKEDTIDIVDVVHPGEQLIKLKASNSHKGPYEFEKVEHVQELKDEHEGPIWCMKFSCCGRLLATAGQDKVLRIWVVRDAFPFFQDMRTKYNAEKVSPTPSQESLVSHHSGDNTNLALLEALSAEDCGKMTFMPKPFCTYTGHTSDLLDVSWSKNYFILSSSMDKTVRLWHISRKECLCCFQHIDFVTAIVFHPRDDRYFLSGSLDGKLRLWNIPDKKVAVWNEVEGNPKLITAANFCQNGKFAVVGTYDGRCIFYNTDQLKYHTQIHVRSSRGRNATGRKISGIEPMPGEDKILVTSNDSRIRLYDLRDLNVSCKYKGYVNMSSQIKASFSHDGKYIVSGSENRDIYIWKTNHDYAKFSSVRRDRNDFWEAIKAHNAVVTCAIFAPNPEAIIKMVEESGAAAASGGGGGGGSEEQEAANKVSDPMVEQHTKGCGGYVLISADFNGCIKVFINRMKPKHSSLPVSAMA